jgi:predicted RNA polymerase sigma factor
VACKQGRRAERSCRSRRTSTTRLRARARRSFVAHCHLGLGRLARRTGRLDEAREHFTTATTMYREMDMRFWLEQAEKEMGKLR